MSVDLKLQTVMYMWVQSWMNNMVTWSLLQAAPVGTKAPTKDGYWYKMESGFWKWNGPKGMGGSFSSPGDDWIGELIYPEK